MKNRAYRRHQDDRAKSRARRLLLSTLRLGDKWITPRLIACWAGNRKPCSCAMCGNPRKWNGDVTRQEQREGPAKNR